MATLYHRKNEIAIDLTGIQNAASIDIHYSGKMYGESQLPDDWQLMSNKNRIVCLSLGNSAPEVLLNYVGLIYIKACTVIDRDLNIHGVHTKIEDIDYETIVFGVGMDGRIGNSHTKVPGPDGDYGFGGTCFPKDINALIHTMEQYGVNPLVLKSVWEQNKNCRKNWDWAENSSAVMSEKIQ